MKTKVAQDDFLALERKFKYFAENERKESFMREVYQKRFNILVHELDETENPQETREKSKEIFDNFLLTGLKIDPSQIHPVDIHRLPQRPIYNNHKKITRPLIIKLPDTFEKHLIMSSLGNLKDYNHARNQNNSVKQPPVFITEHLPQLFQKHRKMLMPQFKRARRERKRTYWKPVDGLYCLFVDNVKFEPVYQ